MDQLTTFADYRVPQLLRHVGVLVYNDKLSHLVDGGVEIFSNTLHELYIRSSTVVSVDHLETKGDADWMLKQDTKIDDVN